MTSFPHDLRLTLRNLAKQPGYSFLVIAMLALGIAGNSAIFSLVHSLLLEPLAFDEPERLVYLDTTAPKWNLELVAIDYSDFHAWRAANSTFESMAVYGGAAFNLATNDGAERVNGARVTHDLARVLRVEPSLGRSFTAEEDHPDGPKVVLLGHGLWQRRFGGDAAVLGEEIRLDGVSYEIIGVLPAAVKYPPDAELWVPAAADLENSVGNYSYRGIGRLLPGVTIERARLDLDAAQAPAEEKYAWKEPTSPVVRPLREHFVKGSRDVAWVLMAAVALVLAIACANVASLMLARSAAREREIGVRLALGAPRVRLVSQLLTESLVLAAIGGGAGVALGLLGLRVLGSMVADALPFWVGFEPNPTALGLCFTVCVATVLVFGLVPAWKTTGIALGAALGANEARGGKSRRRQRTLKTLVVAEMALAQMLLVGAGLMLLSQRQILRVDPGFRAENVLSFRLALPAGTYGEDARQHAFFTDLVRRLEALPGVESAAAINHPPFQGHTGNFFEAEGALPRGEEEGNPVVLTRVATDDYWQTLGVSILAGRAARDTGTGEDAAREIVVNQTFARYFWGEENPVDKRVRFTGDDNEWLTVVGLARDVRHYGPDEDARLGVYLPLGSSPRLSMTLVARTAVAPSSLIPTARRLVRSLDAELPLYQVTTQEEELRRVTVMRRLTAWLFGLFTAVALVLAAGGAYGVLSYAVAQERREIGIRIALGALRRQVLRLVLGRGLGQAAAGAGVGLLAAVACSRYLESLLFSVDARDPRLFAGVTAVLGLVALVANVVPAWNAARLDAMRVLREE